MNETEFCYVRKEVEKQVLIKRERSRCCVGLTECEDKPCECTPTVLSQFGWSGVVTTAAVSVAVTAIVVIVVMKVSERQPTPTTTLISW